MMIVSKIGIIVLDRMKSKFFFAAFCFFLLLYITGCSQPPNPYQGAYAFVNEQDAVTKTLGLSLAHQYKMRLVGLGGSSTNPIQSVTIALSSPKILSKEEGRAILIDGVQQIVQNIQQNPILKEHCPEGGFTEKNVHFSLYIDPNQNAFLPNVRIFSCTQGTLSFLYVSSEDPRGPLAKEEHEAYEEALAQLEGSSL